MRYCVTFLLNKLCEWSFFLLQLEQHSCQRKKRRREYYKRRDTKTDFCLINNMYMFFGGLFSFYLSTALNSQLSPIVIILDGINALFNDINKTWDKKVRWGCEQIVYILIQVQHITFIDICIFWHTSCLLLTFLCLSSFPIQTPPPFLFLSLFITFPSISIDLFYWQQYLRIARLIFRSERFCFRLSYHHFELKISYRRTNYTLNGILTKQIVDKLMKIVCWIF